MAQARSTLSVVIPAYNASDSIADAVGSAMASGADEVIVIDDGSSDATSAIARQAGAECYMQPNSGAAAARKRGAAHARGDFLVFLDADDELIPNGVHGSVSLLEQNPALAVSAGRVIARNADGTARLLPIRYSPVTTATLLQHGYGPWPPAASVIRTSMYRSSSQIDPPALEPRFAEDYEMLIRLSLVGEVAVRDQPTCRYRLAGGKSSRSAAAAVEAKEAIRSHYAVHLGLEVELLTERQRRMAAHGRIARASFAAGDRPKALLYGLRWFLADPKRATSRVLGRLSR